MNAPDVSHQVANQFHELRRRYAAARAGILIAAMLAALTVLWLALAACDYLWEWPTAWRKAALVSGAGVVGAALIHRLYRLVRDARQRRFAAHLEHSFDGFGQRIRTVLDTVDGRVTGPQEMLAALGHQTLGRWETLSPDKLIPARSLAIAGGACLLMILLAAGMLIGGGDFRTAMSRALGFEIPYTELSVTPGDARLLEGWPVEVSLDLNGRTSRDVMLRYRHRQPSADDWIESELLPVEPSADQPPRRRHARFQASLGRAEHPIEYQFVTSIGDTRVYRVDVQPLIQADKIETSVQPPSYTRLDNRVFASTSVTVLEQSTVHVTIETNHPLREAELATGESTSKLTSAAVAAGDDRSRWTFVLPSANSLHWRFTGSGEDGTPMMPVQGRLRVRRDAAPHIRWRDPPPEIRVHTLAELPMRAQVSDDYGINETGIVFQLGGDDEYVLTDWIAEDVETRQTNTTRVKLEEILPLESFALSERDYVSYYAYAVDNRAGGLQRTESDVRYIDIRPLRQFYAEIELDPNTAGANRILIQLDEIIRRQRFLINRTRHLLKSNHADLADQLGTIDRMVESQSELAGLSRFLADFFVSRGNDDVEALNRAEVAMLQAADSLAAGSFDLALVQEQDALRALAEARRNLEIFLIKNPTPRQREALRRLARQLRQKLRRGPPETQQELADTLQRIASEQLQLAGVAEQIASARNSQREDLYTKQTDLLERVQTVREDLGDRLTHAPRMAARIDDAASAMDDLATAARDGQLDRFASASRDTADLLLEIAMQLDALSAIEPVARISAIRDMTTSLASMEMQLAGSRGASSQRKSTTATSGQSGRPEADGEWRARLARRLQRRSETIEDVLAAPVDVGDVETSEVSDLLQQFAEEQEFLQQLEESRQAAARIESRAQTQATAAASTDQTDREQRAVSADQQRSDSEAGMQRATEYAEAARMLDELYHQLVTPRLARLQRMEQRAGQLVQQMAAGQASTQDPETTPRRGGRDGEDPETRAEIRMLQNDLRQEGLVELAEMLSVSGESDDEIQLRLENLDSGGGGAVDAMGLRGNRFAARLLLVSAELTERIQEMILLEISADRDAPVPSRYRRAVDRYFRTLAGDAEAIDASARGRGNGGRP